MIMLKAVLSQYCFSASSFKYLGMIFSDDLKWHKSWHAVFKKLKGGFYAVPGLKSTHPSAQLSNRFIQTLIYQVYYTAPTSGATYEYRMRGTPCLNNLAKPTTDVIFHL